MTEEQESLEAKPFGIPLKVKGINTIVVVILAVSLAATGFLMWENSGKTGKLILNQSSEQSKEHLAIISALDEMRKVNQSIGDLIEEQNYIVLSTEKERQEMKSKLRRPTSLSKKLDH